MADRSYWLDLFTGTTWDEFLKAGGKVSGFREGKWIAVQKIKVGDYLLAYLTGLSRFIGVLEVTGPAFKDTSMIWSVDSFPCRLNVEVVHALTPETAVPILDLRDHLSIFHGLKNPNIWQGAVRGSPAEWRREDGEAVVAAITEAIQHPVKRPVDPRKLARRPSVLTSKTVGTVTVPDDESSVDLAGTETEAEPTSEPGKGPTAHTEIQFLLLKLGSDMGLSVWAASGDKNKEWDGHKFDSIANFLGDLPVAFDDPTNKIIRNIDVLWLEGNSIQAAFEVEFTTSVYSGLLRMSDLLSMQPNLNIPLFIVAPEDRQQKVIGEVNRATFKRLKPPLVDVCRYISFSALRDLRDHLAAAPAYLQVRYLRPDFLQEISESCDPEG